MSKYSRITTEHVEYIRYVLVNGTFLSTLILGLAFGYEGFAKIAIYIAWFTAIIGVCLLNDTVAEATVKYSIEHNEKFVNKTVDVTFDFVIISILVYYGYVFLPAIYLVHMLGVHNYRSRIKEELK